MKKTAFRFSVPRSLLLMLCFYGALFFIYTKPNPACSASTIADSPCDTLYYETLSSRAWLEAQREISQNQNFILKPDSVFQYTCFAGFLGELADHASNMLSETGDFGGPLGSSSMDAALNNLVLSSLNAYIPANFNSTTMLAGHVAAAGITSPTVSALGTPYSCDIMARVWNAARCTNFISYPEYDGFYTFQEYVDLGNADVRHLPNACSASPSTAASALAAKAAYGANLAVALTTGPWSNDPMQTFFNLTGPQNFGSTPCAGTCACTGTPIPTGIEVFRSGGVAPIRYNEHICLQAGCRYHPGGVLYGTTTAAAGCYAR